MEERHISGFNSDGGFGRELNEESLHEEEHLSYFNSNQDRQQVSTYCLTPWRHFRAAAVSLVLLAAALLIVDISLGVHYHTLKDTHLTPEDTEYINNELVKLQDTYKTAVESMKAAKKQLDSEMSLQTPTNWELEHQIRRSNNYEVQLVTVTKDVAALRNYLPMINGGCRHCSPAWILKNSECYYFSSFDSVLKTWQQAREYCQMHGGDLAIIDSKDKENATVNHIMIHKDPLNPNLPYWIGLKDFQEEETWKWLDGTALVEGYWNDGEPHGLNSENCAAVHPVANFFKAWHDYWCGSKTNWICEKASTY